ncbi:cytosolic protein [Alteribacillus sp. YIM 98480]|uniref:cytosolic protein n=1 Tax=Alteribacillus sp. YIM 98480 TaxID=2606599 RepID=UPI00131B3B7C|nr:cytosolic protein [Alteribacillus sp. YIM 98480]
MEDNYKKHRQAHESADSYTDFANVETSRRYLTSETLPEGPYGSPVNRELGKNTPWKEGQRHYTPFNYEYKAFHQNIPRQFPGAHPVHDDPKKQEEYLDTSK